MLTVQKPRPLIKKWKKLNSKCQFKAFSVMTVWNENGKLRLAVFCLGCCFSVPSFRRRPESTVLKFYVVTWILAFARMTLLKDEVMKQPAVYILASKTNGTLYIGVTSDLIKRVWQHKNSVVEGFTRKYSVHRLVWYECHENMGSAISCEKALKYWKRAWKIRLIEEMNPEWKGLYSELV